MAEEIDGLKKDFEKSMGQIARGLTGLAQSLSEQEGSLYDMRAIQTQHGRDVRDVKAEVKLLSGNVIALRSEVSARFGAVENQIASFRAEFQEHRIEQEKRFEQIIALLTKPQN